MWRSKIEIDRRWSKIWRSQWGAAKRSDDRGRWNHSGGRLIVCKCNDVQRSYSKAPKARRELRESLRQFYVGVFNTRDIIRRSGQNSLSWTSLSMTGVRGAARLPWGSPRTIQLWRTMIIESYWIILNPLCRLCAATAQIHLLRIGSRASGKWHSRVFFKIEEFSVKKCRDLQHPCLLLETIVNAAFSCGAKDFTQLPRCFKCFQLADRQILLCEPLIYVYICRTIYIYIQVDLNLPLLVANNVGPQVFEESGSLPDLVQILSRSRLKRNPVLALQTIEMQPKYSIILAHCLKLVWENAQDVFAFTIGGTSKGWPNKCCVYM